MNRGHRGLLTLAAVFAAVAVLPAAVRADHDHSGHRKHRGWVERHDDHWKRSKQDRYGRIRYVTVRHEHALILRPAYEERFMVRRHRVIVVRPTPYWSVPYRPLASAVIGVRTRNVQFDVAFNDRRPQYGCNFCDAYFPTYERWSQHVQACSHRPAYEVVCERWDEDDLDYFCEPAGQACARYDQNWGDWDDGDGHDHDDDDED
jgi:hypothetical protein